jgi:hypothetical protein
VRTHRAVHSHNVHAHGLERRAEDAGIGAVVRLAVGPDGHLRDDGERGQAAHSPHRGAQLAHVAEGLEDEPVHPAFEEPRGLPREGGLRLVQPRLAVGLHPDAERPDRAEHHGPASRRLPGHPAGGRVDPLGLGREAVVGQLEGVRAEGVGLEQLRARLHVFAVDLPHQVRLPERQLVVADVQEDALAIEHRPHRPVEHVHPAVRQQIPE